MRNFKKKLAAAVAVCTAFSVIPFSACAKSENGNHGISVFVNGTRLEFDAEPITENDRTLVPMRAIFEALGAEVEWDDDTHTASAALNGGMLSITENSDIMYKKGSPVALDAPARMIDGITFVPVRAVSESFNAAVEWDEDTKTVFITTAPPDEETAPCGVNGFAFNMNELMNKNENYMFSPMSVKMAMAMAANGSGGDTQSEITKALCIDGIDKYNKYAKDIIERTKSESEFDFDAYNALVEKINYGEYTDAEYEQYSKMRGELAEYEKTPLRIANSIWVNRDYGKYYKSIPEFKPEFENIVREYYDGESKVVGIDDAVEKINGWVSGKTMGKIPSVIDKPDFLAALINAVYFKGKWVYEFSESATAPDTFTNADGTKAQTDFMNLHRKHLDYYSDGRVEGVRLPYTSGVSMYIFKDGGSIKNYEPYFDKMESEYLNVSIPKFKIEYSGELSELLEKMGISKAFSPIGAEFDDMLSGMPEDINVYIDRVIHKTYISVDEKGTEAAAVTAVMMVGASAAMPSPEPKEFKADSPFTFIIRDEKSGEIIFMGRTANFK